MRTFRSFSSYALLVLLLPAAARAQSPAVRSGPVGFRVDRLADSTRPFVGRPGAEPGPRPIQVYLWYPAKEPCGDPVRWRDVVEWVGVEGGHEPLDPHRAAAARDELVAWLASLGADSTAARSALDLRLEACADAQPADGPRPLALLAVGRDDSPALHAALAEELAARGWVVAASPGLGARERGMTFAQADIQAQVVDLAALRRHAASLPHVDAGSPAVLGFSYGGGSAILYAMADTAVAAVVSLDGSIGFADRVDAYVSTPGWNPRRIRAPVLHLRAPDEPRKDLSALESLAREVLVETVENATHYDFTMLGPVSAGGLAIDALGLNDTDGDEIHAAIVSRVADFLAEHAARP